MNSDPASAESQALAPRSGSDVEWVVVALGSNLGDSKAILEHAMDRLKSLAGGPVRRSSLWPSAPVDCPPGSPDFLNAIAAWVRSTVHQPEALLQALKSIEGEFGRRPKRVPNEPRPLDLDLIACGAEIRQSARLTLPHPRATQRAFVLYPLAEILPDLVLPGQALSVRALCDALR